MWELFSSISSIFSDIKKNKAQKEDRKEKKKEIKNKTKVIFNIRCSETKNAIKIDIYNCGPGHMIIEDVKALDAKNLQYSLYEIIPKGIKLKYYSVDLTDYGLEPKNEVVLFETDILSKKSLDDLRSFLKDYRIRVIYHDINEVQSFKEKKLSTFFGRIHRDQRDS